VEAKWGVLKVFTDRRRYCVVKCTCGSVETRREDHVLSGRTKCCKSCASKKTAREHGVPEPGYKGVGDLSGTFWSHIRRGAKKREIGFNLGIEDAWNLFIKQGQRCALSNVLITLSRHAAAGAPVRKEITASLDRKDSSKGYFLSNVQWVHKEINYIKRGLSQKEFIDWCVAVSKSQKETTNGA